MQREAKKNFLIDFLFFITIAAIAYVSFRFLAAYLFPFVIGLIITIFVQKPAKFISKHSRVSKGMCAMILVILTYTSVAVIIYSIGYFIYVQGYKLASQLPQYFNEISETLSQLGDRINDSLGGISSDAKQSLSDIMGNFITTLGSSVTQWIPSFAASVALNTPEFIVVIIVTVVASCYIAKDLDKFKKIICELLKPKYITLAAEIKQIIYTNIFKLIKSYAIIMLITFIELSAGLLILRVNNPLIIAGIIALIDILPMLGCGTVLIPWGIIALIQGSYFLGAGLIVLYVIILVVRNVIEPKIIGGQVGMHPLITLLTIFIGFRLLGVVGMFVLPIVTIVLIQLYKRGRFDFLHFKNDESSQV